MTGYELSRDWWGFAYDNKEVKALHSALYFLITEHYNRLGCKSEFGFPSSIAMEGLSITYNTYKKAFEDLVDWGFINVVQRSKNQYHASIIALSNIDKAFDKATNRALDKATAEHLTKHLRHNKPKEQKTNKPKEQKTNRAALIYPFESDRFYQAWEAWKQYRNEMKYKKYVPKGEQAALSRLGNEASDEDEAIAMIEYSIAQQYKGLYKDKNRNGNNQGRNRQERKRELARLFAEEAAKEAGLS